MRHDPITLATRLSRLLAGCVLAGAMAPAAWADAPLSRTVGGTTIHLGVTPVATALQRAGPHPEQALHSLKRSGSGSQHLTVALFDRSGERITDADVTVTVSEPGLNEQRKPLERMTLGGVPSYGNTFDMKPGALYAIRVVVRRPAFNATTETSFQYRRP
jgi:hypothetical protein